MNILITGANGQLGNEMRIVSRLTTDHYLFTDVNESALTPADLEGASTDTLHLDITDLEAIRQMVKENDIQAIVNCAAWTNVDGAEDPEKYPLVELLNATAPENLAKAMHEVGGLLIQISTDYVFGQEPYNTPCREDQQGTPTGVYGATKLQGERNIIQVFSSPSALPPSYGESSSSPHSPSNLPSLDCDFSSYSLGGTERGSGPTGSYVIIRTAWLYSEFGKNFCKTMLNLTATKPQLKVVFDQCGTPTYARDLANAIVAVLGDYCTHSSVPSSSPHVYSGSAAATLLSGVPSTSSHVHSGSAAATPLSSVPSTGSHVNIGSATATPLSSVSSTGSHVHSSSAAAHPYPHSGIYHFSNEGVCSWYDFTKMIQEYSGHTQCEVLPCHSSEFPSPVTRPAYSVLDKTKIKTVFGLQIPYWTDSLKTCLRNMHQLI